MTISNIKSYFTKLTVIFAAICVLKIEIVVATIPTGPERWKSPCTAQTGDLSSIPIRPSFEIITDMMVQILEGRSYSADLQNKFAYNRIESRRLIAMLDSEPLEGYERVKELSEEDLETALYNVTKAHIDNYRILSIHLVFIEEMRFDEVYEQDSYTEDILKLENKLFGVLCLMNEDVSNSKVDIKHISRDAMDTDLRTPSTRMDRFIRDYVTVKETTKLLDNFIILYRAIKDHLSSSK
ncbi:unnamed protein product [Mytilus coruscus]|uniref:Uncharacterized protein n=1 Tax=Mytilus coruscus TaxID=42192 RepID=A0A6J8D0U1_MYTCO|nr:unnamed protein product [Mytilus coruscus]